MIPLSCALKCLIFALRDSADAIGRAIDKIVKDLILTVVHGGSNIIECFDYAGKGTNNNTFKQISCVKSIKSNTIFMYLLDFRERI